MGDVTEFKPKTKKKAHKRTIVNLCWGSAYIAEKHTATFEATSVGVPEDTALLVIITPEKERICYPLSSIWWWSEKDHPEDGDIA